MHIVIEIAYFYKDLETVAMPQYSTSRVRVSTGLHNTTIVLIHCILLESYVFLIILENEYSQDFAKFPEVNKMASAAQVCEHVWEAV